MAIHPPLRYTTFCRPGKRHLAIIAMDNRGGAMANIYFDAHELIFWIVAIPLAAFALLFFGVFPLILFVASFFETIRVMRLVPPRPDDVIRPSKALNTALGQGFTLV